MHYKTHILYGQYTLVIQLHEAEKLKNFKVLESVITTMKADYSNKRHHITHKPSKMLRPVMCIHDLHKDLWVNYQQSLAYFLTCFPLLSSY